jgi:hypothetical protein
VVSLKNPKTIAIPKRGISRGESALLLRAESGFLTDKPPSE